MLKPSLCIGFFLMTFWTYSQEEAVFFDFNRSDFSASALAQLETFAAAHPEIEVTKLEGYCDDKGSNGYNDTLSLKRIKTVSDFLADQNIKVLEGCVSVGHGEDFLQDKDQWRNRKVVISYRQKTIPISRKPIPSPSPETLSQSITEAETGANIRLPTIYFYNNSARVRPESENVLYELYCALRDNPTVKVEIQGHICCMVQGDWRDVSSARAKAVYQYLIRKRIEPQRLRYKGYGISHPLHPIPEKNDQEEEDNRRVEVKILSK